MRPLMAWRLAHVANNVMREILRRAEGFFWKDRKEEVRLEQEKQIASLEARRQQLNEELEKTGAEFGWIPDELNDRYEQTLAELDAILLSHIATDGDAISPEWTALKKALQRETPSQTPNLRLVIDAIERLKAEGEWTE